MGRQHQAARRRAETNESDDTTPAETTPDPMPTPPPEQPPASDAAEPYDFGPEPT